MNGNYLEAGISLVAGAMTDPPFEEIRPHCGRIGVLPATSFLATIT